ncbi:unnamed protein product [Arctogadus glacialis]
MSSSGPEFSLSAAMRVQAVSGTPFAIVWFALPLSEELGPSSGSPSMGLAPAPTPWRLQQAHEHQGFFHFGTSSLASQLLKGVEIPVQELVGIMVLTFLPNTFSPCLRLDTAKELHGEIKKEGNVEEHTAPRLNSGDTLTPPSTDLTPTNQSTAPISSFLRPSPFSVSDFLLFVFQSEARVRELALQIASGQ